LADGLGLTNLRAKSGYAPFLGAWECQRCLSGFPSTTVVSLGSFGTGLAPGQTALAGYSLRDPRNGQRASLIRWDGASTKPDVWQPHWTLFEQMEALGHPAVFVGEPRFAGSAMTRAALRGAHFISGGMTAATKVTATLRAARASDRLIYLYWGELDRIGHARGWESEAWAVALEELDSSLRQIAKGLPPGWEVWLTADHGMVDVTGGPRWEVSEHPVLAQDVDLIAGEPRALHLYTARPEAVADRWRGFFGPQAWVLTRPEAARAGLFGPIDQRVQPYLGDVVVALAGHGIVLDTAGQGPGPGQMVGHHGSLTETEMAIPLARWRAS
jgi:hypothetical protein